MYEMKHESTEEEDWTTGHGRQILRARGDLEVKHTEISLIVCLS